MSHDHRSHTVDEPQNAGDAGGATANLGFGLSFMAGWVGIGLITACVMKRRGHELRSWACLGLLLGPLLIPLAINIARDRGSTRPVRILWDGRAGVGAVNVVVGLGGSAHGAAVAAAVLDLLGSRVGRVTLVMVLDHESVASDDWRDAKASAVVELELAAALLSDRCDPARVLVGGPAPQAILGYACDTDQDLVILPDAARRPGRRNHHHLDVELSLVALPASSSVAGGRPRYG